MKNIIILLILIILLAGFLFFNNSSPDTVIEALPNSSGSNIITTLSLDPINPKAGESTTLTLIFTDEEGKPVANFMTHHARKVHVLIMAENYSSMGHIHPDDFPELQTSLIKEHKVQFTFPEAGRYIIGTDTMNMDGIHTKQFAINVAGTPGMKESKGINLSKEKCFIGLKEQGANDRYVDPVFADDVEVDCENDNVYKVSLSVDGGLVNKETKLNLNVERNGEAVTDLEPFLDQEVHFAIMPESASTILHRHGTVVIPKEMQMMDSDSSMDHSSNTTPNLFGPNLESEVLVLDEIGVYTVFAQMKHEGNIIFSSFSIEIK
jgi:hypothetical protein